eukprot:1648817-Pyramimonas_sp.AAC.1
MRHQDAQSAEAEKECTESEAGAFAYALMSAPYPTTGICEPLAIKLEAMASKETGDEKGEETATESLAG